MDDAITRKLEELLGAARRGEIAAFLWSAGPDRTEAGVLGNPANVISETVNLGFSLKEVAEPEHVDSAQPAVMSAFVDAIASRLVAAGVSDAQLADRQVGRARTPPTRHSRSTRRAGKAVRQGPTHPPAFVPGCGARRADRAQGRERQGACGAVPRWTSKRSPGSACSWRPERAGHDRTGRARPATVRRQLPWYRGVNHQQGDGLCLGLRGSWFRLLALALGRGAERGASRVAAGRARATTTQARVTILRAAPAALLQARRPTRTRASCSSPGRRGWPGSCSLRMITAINAGRMLRAGRKVLDLTVSPARVATLVRN